MIVNIQAAQSRPKKYYDRRRNVMTKEYEVNDKVLLKTFGENQAWAQLNNLNIKDPMKFIYTVVKESINLKYTNK